jgi:CubicO group peptidase (beta-lactamase class C family)
MILLAILVVSTPVAAPEFVYPDTRAGEIARAYIASFNSADSVSIREFESRYRSAGALEKRSLDERVPRVLGLIAQVGTLRPATILEEGPNSLTLVAHASAADMWLNCTFTIEAEPPHKLVSVAMAPGAAPQDAVAITQWKDLDDLAGQLLASSDAPAIAIAIVRKGSIVDRAVVGERWIDSGQPVERDDRFHIGSITKSMTATMIGALVEKELLDWSFTVADLLGDMEMRDEYRDVTLEQILQHRGGFPAYTDVSDEDMARYNSFRGTATSIREQFLAEVLMREPEAEAGGDLHYSNAGYVVAALMAERVSARSWERLVQEHVFDVAGMKTAGYGWPATPDRPDQPRGHFREDGKLRVQEFGEYKLGANIAPAGDVHCSIEDLARYAILHLRGLAGRDKDFDHETIVRLHTPPDPEGQSYAAGWGTGTLPDIGAIHAHSGSAGTFYANIELYPDLEAALVIATNADDGTGAGIGSQIRRLVRDRLAEKGKK